MNEQARLARAYTLLCSVEPALIRSVEQSRTPEVRRLHQLLLDETRKWIMQHRYPAAQPAPPDVLANRYESALNRIAGLGMDAPAAFGNDTAGFYRDQLMTAIGTAARALASAQPSTEPAQGGTE